MQTSESARSSGGTTRAVDLPQVWLEIARGRARHKSRAVRTAAFLIGSAPDCDLVLGDPRFDALHSYLLVKPDSVTIRRLGEGPPLCIAGREVGWAALADGDRLELGPYAFEVRIDWLTGGQFQQGGNTSARMRPPVADDRAAERLLGEVEGFSPAPQLNLFVGDVGCEQPRPAPQAAPATTTTSERAFHKQAKV